MKTKEAHCSFCGRKKSEALMLISGLEGHICDHCAEQAFQIIEQELGPVSSKKDGPKGKKKKAQNDHLPTPAEIKTYLDQYVIGQDETKKVMAVAVYNHYKRLRNPGAEGDIEIEKSNILLVGETGTGKTLMAKSLAKMLDVPFCIADATVLTEAGYVGEDVESVLSRLLQVADYDAAQAERGIIYLDEVDKISRKSDNPSITRDVSGEGVQQGLLKILEGTVAHVAPEGGRKHPDQKYIKIDTSNILFICGGAFEGIDRIIARRVNSQQVGFKGTANSSHHLDKSNLLKHISPADLKAYGLIPEIIGRLPVITTMNSLDKTALRSILTEPKNALIRQYVKLFELDGVKLKVEDEAIDFIVDQAFEYKLGARGLRSICETIMTDYMFNTPGNPVKELVITRADAERLWKKNSEDLQAA
ncbi:MAG: ATP-dependent Clp protease ATP-binding subunit ClpX [Bacteroidia bacterium]